MEPHHQETIANVEKIFSADPDVLALLVGGSLAHGYARETSDVDIMIIVTPEAYQQRKAAGDVLYLDFDHCTYEGGYIDGKYMDRAYLELVAAKGSEAARYAFKDAIIVFSRDNGLVELIAQIVRYPTDRRDDNIRRFLAQMNAWKWMADEGRRHGNRYLVQRAIDNFVLFSSRVILAHNEILYPFHKWMLRELNQAADRPADMMTLIDHIVSEQCAESMEDLFQQVKATTTVTFDDAKWGTWFLRDSEQNWIDHDPPVADL